MQHSDELHNINLSDAWLTIGSFDGVHLGHRELIKNVTAGARQQGAPAVVLTFHPHPSEVLRGPRESFYLSSPDEKAALLAELGVDLVVTLPFDEEMSQRPAEDFIRMLKERLNFSHLWVGHDFALGKGRGGDLSFLRGLAKELDYQVNAVKAFMQNGKVVSSSRVRNLLETGELPEANTLLTRWYNVFGIVEVGDRRGRTIGVPTANLAVPKERVVPKAGVYACQAKINGKCYWAVTNVGVRPTFEVMRVAPRVEAHLLDFSGDLYNKDMELFFLDYLREEKRFDGADALVAQIDQDIVQARKIFSQMETN